MAVKIKTNLVKFKVKLKVKVKTNARSSTSISILVWISVANLEQMCVLNIITVQSV